MSIIIIGWLLCALFTINDIKMFIENTPNTTKVLFKNITPRTFILTIIVSLFLIIIFVPYWTIHKLFS